MRQLGGSLGIAIMATLLGRITATERAILTEHLGATDPATLERLGILTRGAMSHGAPYLQAKAQAVAILSQQVGAQASVLAFARLYLLNGILLVSALPLFLIWRTGRARGVAPPGALNRVVAPSGARASPRSRRRSPRRRAFCGNTTPRGTTPGGALPSRRRLDWRVPPTGQTSRPTLPRIASPRCRSPPAPTPSP